MFYVGNRKSRGMVPVLFMTALQQMLLVCLLVVAGLSAAMASDQIGRIKIVNGEAQLVRDGVPIPVKVGDAVFASDRLVTGKRGSLGVTMNDGTLISVGAKSETELSKFIFNAHSGEGEMDVSFLRGAFRFLTGQLGKFSPHKVRIITPTATAGIRGTDFVVIVTDPSGATDASETAGVPVDLVRGKPVSP